MSTRHLIYPTADPILRRLFGEQVASAYQLEKAELVGKAEGMLQQITAALLDAGYERTSILAASKRHPRDFDLLDGASIRRVDPDRRRAQYHVHLFARNGGIDVYSHYEYRPDLWPVANETISEAYWRAREHLKPSWGPAWGNGVTYVLGKHDDVITDFVSTD